MLQLTAKGQMASVVRRRDLSRPYATKQSLKRLRCGQYYPIQLEMTLAARSGFSGVPRGRFSRRADESKRNWLREPIRRIRD